MSTKICKHCAMEIPKKAKLCPHCRKSTGMTPVVWWFIGAMVVLFIYLMVTSSP